jgi:uncharacterized protein YlxP (DUF503 family)
MRLGNCIIKIYIPNATSLKEKRSVLKGLKDKIRTKYNVAISEIGENDNHRVSVLAVATVANKHQYVNKVLSSVVAFMEKQRHFDIIDYTTEIL